MSDTTYAIFMGILVFLMGFILGAALRGPEDKPSQKAHNMAQYEIHYQRCLDGPKATVEACHEVAKFKSLVCVGCE